MQEREICVEKEQNDSFTREIGGRSGKLVNHYFFNKRWRKFARIDKKTFSAEKRQCRKEKFVLKKSRMIHSLEKLAVEAVNQKKKFRKRKRAKWFLANYSSAQTAHTEIALSLRANSRHGNSICLCAHRQLLFHRCLIKQAMTTSNDILAGNGTRNNILLLFF